MKIAITGVDGQVGHELASILAPHHEVIALNRAKIDLSDLAAVRASLSGIKPDLLLNCAAYTAVDAAEKDAKSAFRINAEAPGVMAEACKNIGSRLVHFSTDYVFDGTSRRPYREDDRTDPINVYGLSKLAGEQAIEDAGGEYLILRTSWVYAGRGHNFFRTMLRLGRERETIRVVDDQIGSPTSARSIAEAIARLIEPANFPKGTYHLTSTGETSWHGFATEIFRQAREHPQFAEQTKVREVVPISTAEFPTPAKRPAYSVLDNNRFRQTFGFSIPDWREGLEKTFAEVIQ